jgi:hypothetical protein
MKLKQTQNQIQKPEKVKVYIRIRPFNEDEIRRGGDTPFINIDIDNNCLSIRKEYAIKDYFYDGIYDMNSTQEQIFNCSAQPVIDVS